MNTNKFYINGEWVDPISNEQIDVINPATEEVIGSVPLANNDDVDRAVKAAKDAFNSWNNTSIEERVEYMEKIYIELKENHQEIADTIVAELGTSQAYSENVQAMLPIKEVRATIDAVKEYDFEYFEETAKIVKEGYGVVACITPWNFPINQIQRKITPALLAGNTVVVNPASNTPLTALLYAELIDRVNLPKGVFNLITGSGRDAGSYLAGHEDVDVISFTGSTNVGQEMYRQAAGGIKQLVLELGGKSAMIYLEGGDLKYAVEESMDTILDNQGQTCTALTRLLVPSNKLEETKEEIKRYYKEQVIIGNPADSNVVVGPMITEGQKQTVLDYIETGKKEGAEILIGGGKVNEKKGYFVEPTVFVNVTNDMTIAQEEIFGPVLTVITYDTEEEAIEIANDSDFGLSGAVTGPDEKALDVARQLKTGNVYVNGGEHIRRAPFGGYKMSGRGRENGIYGVEDYLEIKALFL